MSLLLSQLTPVIVPVGWAVIAPASLPVIEVRQAQQSFGPVSPTATATVTVVSPQTPDLFRLDAQQAVPSFGPLSVPSAVPGVLSLQTFDQVRARTETHAPQFGPSRQPTPAYVWTQSSLPAPRDSRQVESLFSPIRQPFPNGRSSVTYPDWLHRLTVFANQQSAVFIPERQPIPDGRASTEYPTRLEHIYFPADQQKAVFVPERQPLPDGKVSLAYPDWLWRSEVLASHQTAVFTPERQAEPPFSASFDAFYRSGHEPAHEAFVSGSAPAGPIISLIYPDLIYGFFDRYAESYTGDSALAELFIPPIYSDLIPRPSQIDGSSLFGPEDASIPAGLWFSNQVDYHVLPRNMSGSSVQPIAPIPRPIPPRPPPPSGGGGGGGSWSTATMFPERAEEEFWIRNADRVRKIQEAWANNIPDLIDEERDVFNRADVGAAETTAAVDAAEEEEEEDLTAENMHLRMRNQKLLDLVSALSENTKESKSKPESQVVPPPPIIFLLPPATPIKKKPATIFGVRLSSVSVLLIGVVAFAWWYFSHNENSDQNEDE